MERAAMITGGVDSIEQLQAYLPNNYQASVEVISRSGALDDNGWHMSARIIIRGHDVAGWTLDGYVLPRLASGLIWASEVDA